MVTGADGQLGLTFRDFTNYSDNVSLIFSSKEELDILNINSIRDFLYSNKIIDTIINCAAVTDVVKAENNNSHYTAVNSKG